MSNAHTDPDTGLRFYDWKNEEYPSVTTIRRLIGMPFTLHNWIVSRIIDRATDYQTVEAMLTRPRRPRERALDKNRVEEAKHWLRLAATEERDIAADIGTRAHDAIATGLSPDSVEADIRPYLWQYRDFMQTTGARVLLSERQVYNLTEGYAGALDAVMEVFGHTYVTDYKTSRGVYIDHAAQVMAYAMGEFIGDDDVIDEHATNILKSAQGLAILHLSPFNWEWIEIEATPALFAAFRDSLRFANFLYRHEDLGIEGVVISRLTGGTLVPALAASIEALEGAAP